MSSEPTAGADGGATPETGGQEAEKYDLDYDAPVTVEDVPVVEGRSEIEKLLLIGAKAKGVKGLVACPMATLKDGVPQHLTWVLTAATEGKDGGGHVQKDHYVKWNGMARNLFKDATEDVCLR